MRMRVGMTVHAGYWVEADGDARCQRDRWSAGNGVNSSQNRVNRRPEWSGFVEMLQLQRYPKNIIVPRVCTHTTCSGQR